MLKQRIITALILIPLVVWGVLQLSSLGLALLFAPLILLGAWEWTKLIPIINNRSRLLYLFFTLLLLLGEWLFIQHRLVANVLPAIVSIFWLLSIFWLNRVETGKQTTALWLMIKGLLGLLILSCCWLSVLLIHAMPVNGPVLLLALLVTIWAADSGAYFTGKQWGRHKLAPQVSPKKTWEGFWGGCISGMIVVMTFAINMGWKEEQLIQFAFLSILVVIASVLGDLFESLLKRQQAIKDSGTIFPGHGGVLDRIDSLTAAAPIYLLGLYWIDLP